MMKFMKKLIVFEKILKLSVLAEEKNSKEFRKLEFSDKERKFRAIFLLWDIPDIISQMIIFMRHSFLKNILLFIPEERIFDILDICRASLCLSIQAMSMVLMLSFLF